MSSPPSQGLPSRQLAPRKKPEGTRLLHVPGRSPPAHPRHHRKRRQPSPGLQRRANWPCSHPQAPDPRHGSFARLSHYRSCGSPHPSTRVFASDPVPGLARWSRIQGHQRPPAAAALLLASGLANVPGNETDCLQKGITQTVQHRPRMPCDVHWRQTQKVLTPPGFEPRTRNGGCASEHTP